MSESPFTTTEFGAVRALWISVISPVSPLVYFNVSPTLKLLAVMPTAFKAFIKDSSPPFCPPIFCQMVERVSPVLTVYRDIVIAGAIGSVVSAKAEDARRAGLSELEDSTELKSESDAVKSDPSEAEL